MKHLLIILTTCIFCIPVDIQSQTLHYKAYKGNSEVGYMKLKKICKGNICEYELENKITLSLLISIELGIRFAATFQDDQVILVATQQLRDGKEKESTSMIWKHGKYTFTRDNKSKDLDFKDIDYSSVQMYHIAPGKHGKVFSERFGKYLDIDKKSSDSYALSLPGGSTNTYFYEGGVCTKMVSSHPFATIRFELQNSHSYSAKAVKK